MSTKAMFDTKDIINAVFDDEQDDSLFENTRWRYVPVRIRKGKIQRRRKVSNLKGYTFRGRIGDNKLVRMMPRERMKRRIGARRAKIRRRGKKMQIRVKTRRSMRRLKALRHDI